MYEKNGIMQLIAEKNLNYLQSRKYKLNQEKYLIICIVKQLLKSMSFSNFVDNSNNEYCKKNFKLTAEWD